MEIRVESEPPPSDGSLVDPSVVRSKFQAAEDGEEVTVLDGKKLLGEALSFKETGNSETKRGKYAEAVKAYAEGLEVLSKSNDLPMLQDEKMEIDALKAVLHCNSALCFLHQQLYRRAIDACTKCLEIDEDNVKALHRRSQACEAVKEWHDALRDLLKLRKLGGGGVSAAELSRRCEELYKKQASENKFVNAMSAENEELFKMKAKFDEVLEQYELGDGKAAPQVATWVVCDNDMEVTVKKVAMEWGMTQKEARDFTKWIAKGLELKIIPDPREVAKAAAEELAKKELAKKQSEATG